MGGRNQREIGKSIVLLSFQAHFNNLSILISPIRTLRVVLLFFFIKSCIPLLVPVPTLHLAAASGSHLLIHATSGLCFLK